MVNTDHRSAVFLLLLMIVLLIVSVRPHGFCQLSWPARFNHEPEQEGTASRTA